MPKVEVWCKNDPNSLSPLGDPICVWRGQMDAVPSKGEYIAVFDGWASVIVKAVYYELYNHLVLIEIKSDRRGEYRAKLKEIEDEESKTV